MELDKLGVIVEDRLPDPALAGYGQLTLELFSMLAFAAEAPGPGSMSRALGALWDYLAAMDRRDRFMAARDQSFATFDVFLAPAMPVCAWHVEDGEPGGGSLVCPLRSAGWPMVCIAAGHAFDLRRRPTILNATATVSTLRFRRQEPGCRGPLTATAARQAHGRNSCIGTAEVK